MFRRNTDVTTTHPVEARGGIAGGAILTGVVVAFGAMFILSALIGGVLTALGIAETDISRGEAIDAGIGAGMAFVAAQFLSYLWGGYAAGRMARGAGLANGLLVPLVALILGGLTVAAVAALGATANLNLPFTENRLPMENDYLVNWGLGIGIAGLIAMFLGGALGGGMGARWHTKLERGVYGETPAKTRDGSELEHTTPVTTGGAAAQDHTIDLNRNEKAETTGRPYR